MLRILSILSLLLALGMELAAQRDDTSSGEVSAHTGFAAGAIGTHPSVGAATGVIFSRYGLGLIDVSYMPLGGEILRTGMPEGPVRSSRLYNFDFEGQILIPVSRRWEPYGILGAGLLHCTFQLGRINPQGALIYSGESQDNFAFQTGGGIRYFVGENWGIRPELKVFVSGRNFVRASVGVFYVVGPDWIFGFRRSSRRGSR